MRTKWTVAVDIARAEKALRNSPIVALDCGVVSWREPGWFGRYWGRGLRWRGTHHSDLGSEDAQTMAEALAGGFGRAARDSGVDLVSPFARPSKLYRGWFLRFLLWINGESR